jgi:hypothetical protein
VTYRAPSWLTLATVTGVALVVSLLLAIARPIEMTVDGVRVESDVPPITTANHRVFVPVRSFAGALGAQMLENADGRIDVVRGDQTLRLRRGDAHARINGVPFTMKHPPFLVRGRMMVELDTVAAAFNVRANYDTRSARIEVVTPGIGQALVPARGSSPTQ